jgi:DNA-binding CsgD family transcriptional regulator
VTAHPITASSVAHPLDIAAILVQLSEFGPPSEIRSHAPELAADSLELDRVLLTSVRSGELVAESLHVALGSPVGDTLGALRQHHVRLEYPLLEGEIMRRRRPQLVRIVAAGSPGQHTFAESLGWGDCVVSPIALENRVIGFLHGDCGLSNRELSAADAEALGAFALVFALVYERAVLRMRLRVQRHEMRQVAAWADARAGELEDRLVSLEEEGEPSPHSPSNGVADGAQTGLRDLLTRREIDVLELMVRGDTNAAIARDLVLSIGTIKFHVKNILRKLNAANRAEATSRYLRMTLKR